MSKSINWQNVETVLLDMDGTLLDLHFDTYFWLTLVPETLAKKTGKSIEHCHAFMAEEFAKVYGTISWYCLDYWTDLLDIDIVNLKREIEHLISIRPDTLPFLDALKDSGRKVVLLTNAHPGSLSLKIERTQLDSHIDTLISTHQYGVSKEFQSLWQAVQADVGFTPKNTLFVDDGIPILAAAEKFGIGELLCVSNPDSKKPETIVEDYSFTNDFRLLLDDIKSNPFSA